MNLKYTLAGIALLASVPLQSGAQDAPSYGPVITLEAARKVDAAAKIKARRNNWHMAIAIVDNHDTLLYYAMLDDTQYGSAFISVEKAKFAALFRRPAKAFDYNIARSRTRHCEVVDAVCIGVARDGAGRWIVGGE